MRAVYRLRRSREGRGHRSAVCSAECRSVQGRIAMRSAINPLLLGALLLVQKRRRYHRTFWGSGMTPHRIEEVPGTRPAVKKTSRQLLVKRTQRPDRKVALPGAGFQTTLRSTVRHRARAVRQCPVLNPALFPGSASSQNRGFGRFKSSLKSVPGRNVPEHWDSAIGPLSRVGFKATRLSLRVAI